MKKIVLCGGGDIRKGELKEIDSEIINSLEDKNVYVLDLSADDPNKIEKYKVFLGDYFSMLGAVKVEFISDFNEDEKIDLNNFGMVYLPGGDPLVLLNNLLERKIDLRLFEGVVLGNSAGALVLSKHLIITKDEDFPETIVKEGLGIVPFSVEVHYDGSQDLELRELDLEEDIYLIPEKSFVIVENGEIVLGPGVKVLEGN